MTFNFHVIHKVGTYVRAEANHLPMYVRSTSGPTVTTYMYVSDRTYPMEALYINVEDSR